jgi:predicted phosphate transport protein (TIGR00153 family)
MAFFNILPREIEYFALFTQMTEKVQHAADALVSMMADDPKNFEAHSKRIKDAEHGADELTHRITTKLNKSFITPFDREDIYMLSVALDDVIDYIDAGARAIRMYNIVEINDHARAFARVIQSLTVELHSAVSTLQKPKDMNKHIVEIHRLENEADEIYFRSIGELFSNSTDPVKLIKWKELYEILEAATDRCESVANIIESIILKHN